MANTKKSVCYTAHISFSLIFLLLFIIQYCFNFVPKIHGATAVLLVPAVIALAAQLNEWYGFTYGLTVGFLLDSITSESVFFCTLCLALIGFFSGFLIQHLFNPNIFSVGILGLGGCIVYFFSKLFIYIFDGITSGIGSFILYHSLPSAIYSFIFTIPLFYLFGKIISKTDKVQNR